MPGSESVQNRRAIWPGCRPASEGGLGAPWGLLVAANSPPYPVDLRGALAAIPAPWCGRRFRTAAHQAKGSPAAASAVGGPVRRHHGSQPVAPACSTHGLPALVGSWQAGQLSGAIRIRGTLSIPAAELAWRFSRSSGPGGQHVNTADSRVELLFDLASSPSIPPVLKARAIQRLGPRLRDGVLVVVASR